MKKSRYLIILFFIPSLLYAREPATVHTQGVFHPVNDDRAGFPNDREIQDAQDLFEAFIPLRDSVYHTGPAGQPDEIQIRYTVYRYLLEKERNRNYALFATALLLLTLSVITIWFLYSRRLYEKNRSLVRRLREQDRLTRQLHDERRAVGKLLLAFVPDPPSPVRKVPETENTATRTEDTDPLYSDLLALMDRQIYTDPGFNRLTLINHLSTSEHHLADLVKHYFNLTISDLITSYRLQHARRLLADPRENLTISAIALDSGFGGRATLHRLFRKYYGLSPTEFRRLTFENEKEREKEREKEIISNMTSQNQQL